MEHLKAGGVLTLQWATSALASIDGGTALPLRMRRSSARRLAENAAITVVDADPKVYVVNVDEGPKPGDTIVTLVRRDSDGKFVKGETTEYRDW